MTDKQAQLEEVEILQSEFPEDEMQIIEDQFEKKIKLVFWIYPALPRDFRIKYKETLEDRDVRSAKITYMPPMEFYVKLPYNYPSERSPIYHIFCRWLSKEDTLRLNCQLDEMWYRNPQSEIIYPWADFLKNDSLRYLGYEREMDVTVLNNHYMRFKRHRDLEFQALGDQGQHNKDDYMYGYEIQYLGPPYDCDRETYRDKVYAGLASLTNKIKKITNWSSNSGSGRTRFRIPEQELGNFSIFDRRVYYMLNLKASPVKLMLNYNADRDNVEFERKRVSCVICFSEFKGRDCFRFDACNHFYCKTCIIRYFTSKIKEGNHPIKCPEGECNQYATVSQVKELVPDEVFLKYDDILVQSALENMDQIIYCPRPSCQNPAAKDKDGTLGICPYCQYSFCIFCRMGYHGIEPCKFNDGDKKKLVDKYLGGSKEEKELLEMRYGKSQMTTLVNDTLAENWIQENCKNCPKCNVSIEKSEGCNKMICWKCNTYFCWLCSVELDRVTPYAHFNDPNSPCSNKLFFLTPLGDDDIDDEYNSDDEQWRDWDWI